MRVVVAGGTGFLGSALVRELRAQRHAVTILTRHPRDPDHVRWTPDGTDVAWVRTLENVDAVISLVGAPIDRRWTPEHKREIRSSRVHVTRTLVNAIKSVNRTPATFISGSAMGIYGAHGDEAVTEGTRPGTGFLADVAKEWESEALAARPQARVVLVRTGVVLDRSGGALPQIARPFKWGAGGPLGSGHQHLSWIHRDDWTALVGWALSNAAVSGPLNATAPNPVTNQEFAMTLGRVLHRPALARVPAFALRLLLGEMADTVLTGQRVLPEKALALGFTFRYPTLEAALRAIYRRESVAGSR
jgi:uncharacterized protein